MRTGPYFFSFRPAVTGLQSLAAWLLLACAAQAAAPHFPSRDFVALPLSRGKQNQLVLRLPANGRDAVITLDTGSPVSCVDESKAKLFNLRSSATDGKPPMSVMVNGQRHRIAIVPSLNMGVLEVQNMPVVLINLGDLNQMLRARHDLQNDAILGLDMLHTLHAIIDCGSQRLILPRNPDGNAQAAALLKQGGWQEVPLRLNDAHITAPGSVQRVPLTFIVDTGSPVTVLDQGFSKSHHIALDDRSFSLKAIHFETNGAHLGKVNNLRIYKTDIGPTMIAVFNVTTLLKGANGPVALDVPSGLLGAHTLERTRAFIDCDTMKLYLKPSAAKSDFAF
jgi:predicted aspartyl protease